MIQRWRGLLTLISIITPSVMPEEKFKIICRAGKVVYEHAHTLVSTVRRCGWLFYIHTSQCKDIICLVIVTQELHRVHHVQYKYKCHSTVQLQVHPAPHTHSHTALTMYFEVFVLPVLYGHHVQRGTVRKH